MPVFRNQSQFRARHEKKQDEGIRTVFQGRKKILIQGSLLFGSMLVGMWAVFSWMPTWIQSLLGEKDGQTERSIAMMVLGLGGLAGGFASGWVARGLGIRRAMRLCFLACFVLALALFGLNRSFSPLIYAETAALAVFFGISQGLLASYIPQLFDVRIRGTATGISYNAGRVITTAAVFFLGSLVALFGGYGNALLAFSFVFLPGLAILSLGPGAREGWVLHAKTNDSF
ncbi:MAG: MFS transporter [Bacteroidales bacterium]